MLRIPLDKLCVIITMARQSLGREAPESDFVPMDGSDSEGAPLPSSEEYDEAGQLPLFDYVDALNGDELADLLALVWVGGGEFSGGDWPEAVAAAEEELADGDGVAEILQDPTLPGDLIAGLEALGYDCPEE